MLSQNNNDPCGQQAGSTARVPPWVSELIFPQGETYLKSDRADFGTKGSIQS